MEFKITQKDNKYVVAIDIINLVAEFDSINEMTLFIQSMLKNVTSY
jgi:hypothetical protein